MPARKPTREELLDAADKTVPDLAGRGMRAVFCGINPSLYTAAIGFHFGRPGNRFWPAIARAGITPRLFDPSEQRELLKLGYGITNIVDRATASADELTQGELVEGAKNLRRKVLRWRPKVLGILGASAYRIAFGHKSAKLGPQGDRIGDTIVWLLPNPSGLNAHYQVDALARLYRELHDFVVSDDDA
jgi:TDG/mug DNA glycosylase family protein